MNRIFPTHAYSDGLIDGCYWAETVPNTALERPALIGDRRTKVAIIGGGFTGLSAALHLAQSGVDVTVLEAKFPGWGASGRNGGFCCLGGSKLSTAQLARRFGADGARAYRGTEVAAVHLVRDLLQTHAIDADAHSDGETILAHTPRAMHHLRASVGEITDDYGAVPTVIEPSELAAHGMRGAFHGGLTIPHGIGLNPRKYLAGLLVAAEAAGARVHGQSPVASITRAGAGYRLTTPAGAVECDRLILATNGYSSDDVPDWMAARYLPAQSSVIVTRPLTPGERADGWSSDQMAYDSRNLLHYFRLMPDGRFLFGMRGGLGSSPQSEVAIARATRRDFAAMFPFWDHVETPHYWSGMVCLAASLTPYCGPIPGMPGAFAGFAYHGNGVAMGSYVGALLSDLARGVTPSMVYPAALSTPPPKFPMGRYRRALMWPGYAGAWLKDR